MGAGTGSFQLRDSLRPAPCSALARELAVGRGWEYLYRGNLIQTLQFSAFTLWRTGFLAQDFGGHTEIGRFEEVSGTMDKGVAREGGQGSSGIVDPKGWP